VKVVALHGLPTSPRLWEKLSLPPTWQLTTPQIPGLGQSGTAPDWSLESCAEQLRTVTQSADVVIGHDLGGVLCAMNAQPGQTIVLSGTALGLYWWMIRATALPIVQQWFYQRHGGRHFLANGCLPEHAPELLNAFGDHGPDWSNRMRQIAQAMKPPRGLAASLHACTVKLAWGQHDPWYPSVVAHAVQRATKATLHWLPAGHFAPWEAPELFTAVLTGVQTPTGS
jgi:pimeloyl-ACP methyl ester carboxylesterase